MALMPVPEALARILEGVAPTEGEQVALLDAAGRVLATDLKALVTHPPFSNSAMDGYALAAMSPSGDGASLKVVGTSAAGRGYHAPVAKGEAVRIFTGAPLPAGTDTVVIQENVDRAGDVIVLREAPATGANVRLRGIDFEPGETLLRAGRVLDPHALTLAATMGHGALAVRRRPVVAILATGDELVVPGEVPGRDQIVSSVPAGLAATVARAGGTPRLLGIAPDDVQDIAGRIAAAEGADIIVTVGGASVGDHDLTAAALEARGMTLAFWKVAIRPGKPLMFGHIGRTRVLGLPGNPASALVCAHVFLVPLIRALLGLETRERRRETARLVAPIEANGSRLHLMRATVVDAGGGQRAVTPLPSQDSSLVSALAAANCLIVRAPGAPAAPAGSEVEIEPLDV